MARTMAYYEADSTETGRMDLCFICAVKFAAAADPDDARVSLVCTGYEHTQCEVCKKFIRDQNNQLVRGGE